MAERALGHIFFSLPGGSMDCGRYVERLTWFHCIGDMKHHDANSLIASHLSGRREPQLLRARDPRN